MSAEAERASPAAPRRGGRRRDATLDGRIMAAAVELYAVDGWSGFNFEAVARLSGVGKPAVYRRWSSREGLLGAALGALSQPYEATNTGTIDGDLEAWATGLLRWWVTPGGAAFTRMYVDQRFHPELQEPYRELVVRPHVAAARRIVRRAVDRGELPPDQDPNLLLEAVSGAMFTRVSNTRPADLDELESHATEIAAQLVALMLSGARDDPAAERR